MAGTRPLLSAWLFWAVAGCTPLPTDVFFFRWDEEAECWSEIFELREGEAYADWADSYYGCDDISLTLAHTTDEHCELWPVCWGPPLPSDPHLHEDVFDPLPSGLVCAELLPDPDQPRCEP